MLEVWDELRAMERRLDDLFRTRSWFTFLPLPSGLHGTFMPATDVFARNGDLVVRAGASGHRPR